MQLNKIAKVQSGYISRGKTEMREDGSHFLLQARDVDGHRLTYRTDTLIRFNPILSRKDWILQPGDVLFMARGVRNYSVVLQEIPDPVLAAACFFIVRVSSKEVLPAYLYWYLNQAPAKHYLRRYSGRGVLMPVVTRSVLENMDIPLPSLQIQKNIAHLNALMQEEQELLQMVAKKRRELITAACLEAVQNSQDTRIRK